MSRPKHTNHYRPLLNGFRRKVFISLRLLVSMISCLRSELTKERGSKGELTPLKVDSKPHSNWRNLVAYWLLGLCNNYGYVVMLSAAHDILSNNVSNSHDSDGIPSTPALNSSNTMRDCNQVSTGAILLADIIPSLLIKLMAPFFPFHVHLRMMAVVLLSGSGFLLVALSTVEWMAILGVVATSFGSGLGEVTLLSYSSFFDKNVVSTWSSGTGGAGIFGAISYAGLTGLGLTPVNSLLIMLVVPVLMAFTFWVVLKKPDQATAQADGDQEDPTVIPDIDTMSVCSVSNPIPSTFIEKLKEVPTLFKFMVPLGAVYFFEYFINQGLFELIEFRGISLDHHEQYRWLQVDYQIGVFISRSSVNLITIPHIWVMAALQFVNVIIFTMEVVYFYVPSIWIIFAFVLWEGLLGGAAYVNTFYRISNEVPFERREFSMGITSLADAVGIAMAGFISMPVHNALCRLPYPIKQS